MPLFCLAVFSIGCFEEICLDNRQATETVSSGSNQTFSINESYFPLQVCFAAGSSRSKSPSPSKPGGLRINRRAAIACVGNLHESNTNSDGYRTPQEGFQGLLSVFFHNWPDGEKLHRKGTSALCTVPQNLDQFCAGEYKDWIF